MYQELHVVILSNILSKHISHSTWCSSIQCTVLKICIQEEGSIPKKSSNISFVKK